MDLECIAQEKELLEIAQLMTVESLRDHFSSIRTPKSPEYREKGEEGAEVTMEELLNLA